MPVRVERRLGRGVPHARLNDFHVGARPDEQRRQVVPQVVEAQPVGHSLDLQACGAHGALDRPWRPLVTGPVGDDVVSPPLRHPGRQRKRKLLRDGHRRPRRLRLFTGLPGHCSTGCTTARMKSTSVTRRPHASAVRGPTNAPSRTAGRRCAGMTSCNGHTCSVVATNGSGLPAPSDVRRLHCRGYGPGCRRARRRRSPESVARGARRRRSRQPRGCLRACSRKTRRSPRPRRASPTTWSPASSRCSASAPRRGFSHRRWVSRS